jgi:hypothetical protein
MSSVTISGFNGTSTVEEVTTYLEALEAAGLSPEVKVLVQGTEIEDLSQPVEPGAHIVTAPAEVKAGA